MPRKRKDDIKRILTTIHIEESLDLVIQRVRVEEKGKRTKQEIYEDAVRKYVEKYYDNYYKEYKKVK